MDTDNTRGAAEPSPASAGSQPVAFAVFGADGHCVGTYATQEHARIVTEELACDGMVCEPLYRQPTLTDEEREAIAGAIASEHGRGAFAWAATLKGLLERLG